MLNDDGRIDSDDERYGTTERGCRVGDRIDLEVSLSYRIAVQIRSRMFHLLNSTENCFDCSFVVVDFAGQGFFLCKLAPLFHTEHLFESLNED